MLARAQNLGDGRLVISTPSDMLSCEAATIEWDWTGSATDLLAYSLQVAVEQISDSSRRSLAEPSPIRYIRKRSQSKRAHHVRDVAINIAGGSDVPMSAGTWTWNSVGIPQGTYRMALSIEEEGYTAYGEPFTVSLGDDTSCLGSLVSSTVNDTTPTTTVADQTSTAPADVTTTFTPTNVQTDQQTASSGPAASTTTALSTSANSPTNSAESAMSNESASSGSKSGGKIAAAVIVSLLAAGGLLFFFWMRRNKKTDNNSTSQEWSEKFTGFFGGLNSKQSHKREISTPMDPVHAAGLAMHDHAVKTQMRQMENSPNAVTQTTEHWVDFHSDAQDHDAHLVSPQRVDEMVRASMENSQRPFYQQGGNDALRQSTSTSEHRLTMMTESDTSNSTLPSYLRDADFTSHHTHSSFGHDANGTAVPHLEDGVTLSRSATQKSETMERSNSKIRRKPVPTYSTIGVSQATGSTSTLVSDEASPFSDVHGVSVPIELIAGRHDSVATTSTAMIQDDRLQEILTNAEEENGPEMRTPTHSSARFPVSVYSSISGSPAPRILLDTPRGSMTEEEQRELYKLSIHMPQEDRGFRVSF